MCPMDTVHSLYSIILDFKFPTIKKKIDYLIAKIYKKKKHFDDSWTMMNL